jgi:tetratricopeptide (TPR) repeat protein
MIRNSFFSLFFLLVFMSQTSLLWSQEPDDIALDTDEFQIYFYESLKQKGIENYDKAITALNRCEKLQPSNAVVFFELGKNYLYQKDYVNAYSNFEKATQLDPSNRWYWAGLYDVSYARQDYENAIIYLQKLITFKKEYKEELVTLYMYSQKFDDALKLIDELTATVGKSVTREQYRAQIMSMTQYKGQEESNLLNKIKANPKEEVNYIALIHIYSEANQEDKATAIAKQLEKEIPTSDWAQISLFKNYVNESNGVKASESLNKILKSNTIDTKIKHRVFNEFLIFATKNPQFESDLEQAVSYFTLNNEVKVAMEVGIYYQNKKDWDKALKYYEMYFNMDPNDLENQLLLLNVYVEKKQFASVAIQAEKGLERFPLQPEFYLYGGLANNQLKNFKRAKDYLEMGLDYIVDNPTMEANFYLQLSETYNGLGDLKKKETYLMMAQKLVKQNK